MTTTDKMTRSLADVLLAHAPGFKGKKRNEDRALLVARMLRKIGKRAHKLAEIQCNREMTDSERAEDEETDETFRALCLSIGCKANLSGDPRGHVAHIVFPDGTHNTWGGSEHGYGVTGDETRD